MLNDPNKDTHKEIKSDNYFFSCLNKQPRDRSKSKGYSTNSIGTINPSTPNASASNASNEPRVERSEPNTPASNEHEIFMKIRLVLKTEFSDASMDRLQKLKNSTEKIVNGSDEELELGVVLIKQTAEKYGVQIGRVRKQSRIIELLGSIDAFEDFFQVEIDYYGYETLIKNVNHVKVVLGHDGMAHIPNELDGMIHSILGLKNTPLDPQAIRSESLLENPSVSAALGKTSKWMAEYYNYPKEADGKGQHIAVITCGGGFSQADFDQFFQSGGFNDIPPIRVVSVDNVKNEIGTNWLYDYEVATDCLVAACAAPGVKISVYFCNGEMVSFINAIEQILDEGDDGPSIISYSWGAGEDRVKDEIEGVNRILKEATIDFKKTIFCASGDFGSSNNASFPKQRDELEVIFPSSSPWVTSCGGTMFAENENGGENHEMVWNSVFLYGVLIKNSTGGGFSNHIKRPEYQTNIVPDLIPAGYINPDWIEGITDEEKQKKALINKFKSFRGVPDVGGHASVTPGGFGYWIFFQNKNWLTGGTSAVAPLWSALAARLNQALGEEIGFFNPYLYEMAGSSCFKPITEGNNGLLESNTHWVAGEPWNPCTGLGVPNGDEILKWMRQKLDKE